MAIEPAIFKSQPSIKVWISWTVAALWEFLQNLGILPGVVFCFPS